MSGDTPAPVLQHAAPPRQEHRVDGARPPFVGAVLHHRQHLGSSVPSSPYAARAAHPSLHQLVGSLVAGTRPRGPEAADDQLGDVEAGLARVWGADQAFLTLNGPAGANQALLLAGVRPGTAVLVARDAQVSTHAALIMTGAVPVWVSPRVDSRLGVGAGLHAADVAAALDSHPAIRLVHLISPSYLGVSSDLSALRAVTAARGVALVVDETAGPHLRWHPGLATDAVSAGADATITSLQGVLPGPVRSPALSRPSVLLLRGSAFDPELITRADGITGRSALTRSVTESVDSYRARLETDGFGVVGHTVDMARRARSMLAKIPGLQLLTAADLALPLEAVDPCRIVMDVRGRGLDGPTAERLLREEHGIEVDGSDARTVHLVISPGHDIESLRHLVMAVAGLGSWAGSAYRRRADPLAVLPRPGEQVVTPREAWFAATRAVPMARSVGRVCAELVTPYPPGIPVVTPGEMLTAECVAWLMEATACRVRMHGALDPTLATVRVLTDR